MALRQQRTHNERHVKNLYALMSFTLHWTEAVCPATLVSDDMNTSTSRTTIGHATFSDITIETI